MIIFHLCTEKKEKEVERIAGEIGHGILKTGYGDLNKVLLGLCENKSLHKDIKLPLLYNMPEVLIFYKTEDEELDRFLDMYRETGLEGIKLKSIITPTNINWTLYELIEELKKESAFITQ
ncbi:MAG: DUF3783 domain-containing protein [Lachnospiraceae bacterium]|nr:DUF3783 domain-containing protein [Lachnospiraceae bacterium]